MDLLKKSGALGGPGPIRRGPPMGGAPMRPPMPAGPPGGVKLVKLVGPPM